MAISRDQHDVLMKDLRKERVTTRVGGGGKNLSYLEAWEVKANLIRVFGFGGFDAVVEHQELLHKDTYEDNKGKKQHLVVALARVCLRIHGVATYTEVATGSAVGSTLGDVFDQAFKTAESDALKRAATYLGTQFGLSLYNDGALRDVVKVTLVVPEVSNLKPGEASGATQSPADVVVDPAPTPEVEGQEELPVDPEDLVPSPHADDVTRIAGQIREGGLLPVTMDRLSALSPLVEEVTKLKARSWVVPEQNVTLGRLLDQALAGDLA